MNTRTITIEDTPALTLADYKSNNIAIADALHFKLGRIYTGVTKDQGSYKFINRAVRGFSKSVAVHRASKPSKRKAAIGVVQKMALSACKVREMIASFPITTDEAQAFNDLAPLASAARSQGFRVAIADLEPQKNSKEI